MTRALRLAGLRVRERSQKALGVARLAPLRALCQHVAVRRRRYQMLWPTILLLGCTRSPPSVPGTVRSLGPLGLQVRLPTGASVRVDRGAAHILLKPFYRYGRPVELRRLSAPPSGVGLDTRTLRPGTAVHGAGFAVGESGFDYCG